MEYILRRVCCLQICDAEVNICFRSAGNNVIAFEVYGGRGPTGKVRGARACSFRFHLVLVSFLRSHWNNDYGDSSSPAIILCNTDAARTFNMSDNGVYGLGALELRLADAGLDLRLSSEVKIATSAEDGSDNTSRTHGLTTQLFHGKGPWKPWVVKSHGYQLRVDLDIAPDLAQNDEAFAHHVAAKLKHFKAGHHICRSMEYADTASDLGEPWARRDLSRDMFE